MRCIKLKKGLTWQMLGWFIFILLVGFIVLLLMGKFGNASFNLVDKLFGN